MDVLLHITKEKAEETSASPTVKVGEAEQGGQHSRFQGNHHVWAFHFKVEVGITGAKETEKGFIASLEYL